MTRVLLASAAEDLRWIIDHAPCVLTAYAKALKAVDDTGAIRGMVAFDNWTESSAQIHMAALTPLAWRRLLPAAARFIFEYLGKAVVYGLTPAGNIKALALSLRAGFRQPHRIRDGWAKGEDLVVSEMRRDECRWLNREVADGR